MKLWKKWGVALALFLTVLLALGVAVLSMGKHPAANAALQFDGKWTPLCDPFPSVAWQTLHQPLKNGDDFLRTRIVLVGDDVVIAQPVNSTPGATFHPDGLMLVGRDSRGRHQTSAPVFNLAGTPLCLGTPTSVTVIAISRAGKGLIFVVDPHTLKVTQQQQFVAPIGMNFTGKAVELKRVDQFPDGSLAIALVSEKLVTGGTQAEAVWLYRFDPHTNQMQGPVTTTLTDIRWGLAVDAHHVVASAVDANQKAAVLLVNWETAATSVWNSQGIAYNQLTPLPMSLPAGWTTELASMGGTDGFDGVTLGQGMACPPNSFTGNPGPTPLQVAHDKINEFLGIETPDSSPWDSRYWGPPVIGFQNHGQFVQYPIDPNTALAWGRAASLFPLALFTLDADHTLVLQSVRPAPELGPAAAKGLIRFGIITSPKPDIAWFGYVPLPDTFNADAGFYPLQCFATDSGWVIGFHQGDANGSIFTAEDCYWTRLPYPSDWSYTIRGELTNWPRTLPPRSVAAGTGGTP